MNLSTAQRVRLENLVTGAIAEWYTNLATEAIRGQDFAARLESRHNQVLSNLTCLGDIVASLFENGSISDQEKESVQYLLTMPIKATEVLIEIIATKSKEVFEYFLDLLKRTNQHHVYQLLISNDSDQYSVSEHSRLIACNYKWLTEHLESESGIVAYLYESKTLTIRELEQVDSEKSSIRKSEILLSLISRKSLSDFEMFLRALQNTGQESVLNKLQETKDSLPNQTTYSRVNAGNEHSETGKADMTIWKRSHSYTLHQRATSFKEREIIGAENLLPITQNCLIETSELTSREFRSKPALPPKPKFLTLDTRRQNKKERTLSKLLIQLQKLPEELQNEISAKTASVLQNLNFTKSTILKFCLQKLIEEPKTIKQRIETKEQETKEFIRILTVSAQQKVTETMKLNSDLQIELNSVKEMLVVQQRQNQEHKKAKKEIEEQWKQLSHDIKKCQNDIQQKEIQLKTLEEEKAKSVVVIENLMSENQSLKFLKGNAMAEKASVCKDLEQLKMEFKERENAVSEMLEKYIHHPTVGDYNRSDSSEHDANRRTLEELVLQYCNEFESMKENLDIVTVERDELKHQEEMLRNNLVKSENKVKELEEYVKKLEQELRYFEMKCNRLMKKVACNGTDRIIHNDCIQQRLRNMWNNYDYLLEELDSRRVIENLFMKRCITEPQRVCLSGQTDDRKRTELLLILIHFLLVNGSQIVFQCIRESHPCIADVLLFGGVAVKVIVHFRKGLLRNQTFLSDSLNRIYFERMNDPNSQPNEINKFHKMGIELLPCCRIHDTNIVLWMRCRTDLALYQLHQLCTQKELLRIIQGLFRSLCNVSKSNISSSNVTNEPTEVTVEQDYISKIIDCKSKNQLRKEKLDWEEKLENLLKQHAVSVHLLGTDAVSAEI